MPLDAYPPSPTATPPTWATPPALHNFFQPPQLGPFWEFSTPPAKVGGLQAMPWLHLADICLIKLFRLPISLKISELT